MSVEEEGFKQCPECAELVRAQARKCRFCGWRFDAPEPTGTGGGALLRSSKEPTTLTALLEQWRTPLQEGEKSAFFVTASSDRGSGFLLITDQRVCFFGNPRRMLLSRRVPPAELLFSMALSRLVRVCREGRLRPVLRLVGVDDQIEIRGVRPRARAQEIAGFLEDHPAEP